MGQKSPALKGEKEAADSQTSANPVLHCNPTHVFAREAIEKDKQYEAHYLSCRCLDHAAIHVAGRLRGGGACCTCSRPAGCRAATEAAGEATAAPAAEGATPLKIAFSVPDMAFPFFVFMETQVRAEADELGGIEIVTLDGQNNLSKQTADVEAAIAQGVDGLVISPITSDGMAPAVQQAIDAGIPGRHRLTAV